MVDAEGVAVIPCLVYEEATAACASVRDLAAESLMRFNKDGGFRGVDVD